MKNRKTKGEPAYKILMLVKDPSTSLDDNLYKIYLYSHNGLGKEFFPNVDVASVPGSNHYSSKLRKFQQVLLKFNVHVEAIVEKGKFNNLGSLILIL